MRAVPVAGTGLVLGFCWLAGGFATFTVPAEICTFVAGAAMVAYGMLRPRPDQRVVAVTRRSWWFWGGWLAAVTGWELWALFSGPRSAHPTISSLLSPLLDTHPARALALLLWLAFGWWLARR